MAKQVFRQSVGPVLGLAFGLGIAISGWSAMGPDHLGYALVVQVGFMFTGLSLGPSLVDVARVRYRVAPVEPRVFAFLGAGIVLRFLDAIGWSRVVARLRHGRGEVPVPRQFVRGSELSETGHLIGLMATAVLVIIALAASYPRGAAQVLLVGLLLHAYPVMIQRMLRFRVIGARADLSRALPRIGEGRCGPES